MNRAGRAARHWHTHAVLALASCLAATRARADSEGRDAPRAAEPKAEWQPSDDDLLESHHGRSLLEMGGGLALGAVLYWLMMDRNVADWDNPTPQERFDGTAWRLDNNSLGVNFIAHPLFGGAAYSFARANHHRPLGAFGYSFLTSFLWEFVLEFKEKVSVNDVIVTPGTGVPIGEFFHKLGLYLDTAARPNTLTHVARWSLGTGVARDRALDGRPPPLVTARDELGLTRAIWHEFELDYAVAFARSPTVSEYVRHQTAARGKLVTLPGYLRPGNHGRGFYGAEISEFAIGAEGSRHGAGMTISADTLIAGYHSQRIAGAHFAPRGHAATLGASVAYFYLKSKANDFAEYREAVAQPDPDLAHHKPKSAEQFSAFHLPGPAFDWHLLAPSVALRLSIRAHPDFVGFGAPAFYDWAAANLDEKGKHILHRQGYFYGWGASATMHGSLRIGPVRLAGTAFYGRYWSQDGLDRHIERVTVDVPAKGRALLYDASIGVAPPGLPLVFSASFGVRHWRSNVAGFERDAHVSQRGLGVSYLF
jgi:hypothetical protein